MRWPWQKREQSVEPPSGHIIGEYWCGDDTGGHRAFIVFTGTQAEAELEAKKYGRLFAANAPDLRFKGIN